MSQIQGSMREAPLPDIIQLVSQGSKSGCFHVSDEPRRCKVYLRDGRIVHAVSQDHEGLEAFYEAALWLDGSYRFEEGEVDLVPTITRPNASVLMEFGRRMAEWRVISQRITSTDLYPTTTLLPGEAPQGVNPRQARLLPFLTGWYTVQELADLQGRQVLELAKELYDLVMGGQVVMKGIRSGRAPRIEAPEPAPAPAPPVPVAPPAPVPEAPAALQAVPVTVPSPQVHDPVKMARLTAFTQRISVAAKLALPEVHHEMVDRLQARATQQIFSGDGPEAVKNLALAISRGAVDHGCDGEVVKTLNAQLKALFSK